MNGNIFYTFNWISGISLLNLSAAVNGKATCSMYTLQIKKNRYSTNIWCKENKRLTVNSTKSNLNALLENANFKKILDLGFLRYYHCLYRDIYAIIKIKSL